MVHSIVCLKFIDGMYFSLAKSEKMSENLISGKTSLKGPKTSAKKQKSENKAKESSKGKRTQLGM